MAIDLTLDEIEDISARYLDRRLITGSALLMTSGFLVWLAGATAGTIAVVGGARRYVSARDEPPLTTVRRRVGQARSSVGASVGAGVGAWNDYKHQ